MNDDVHAQLRQEVEELVKDHFDGYGGVDLILVVHGAGVIALERKLGALDKMERAARFPQPQKPSL